MYIYIYIYSKLNYIVFRGMCCALENGHDIFPLEKHNQLLCLGEGYLF
jgi:hypothetical protein